MKTAKYLFVALGLLLLLTSCFLSNPWLSRGENDSAFLPPDSVNDTTRSSSEPFQFKTLLPVSLNLEIDFYEMDPDGVGSVIEALAPQAGNAVVILTDSGGNVVYEGPVQADGTVAAQLVLPATPENMVLTVKALGYEDRSVTISNLVGYSAIDRRMGMMSEDTAAKSASPSDRDGDSVPDIYDAFPDDPDYAFIVHYPENENDYMTVAYEDLYLKAAAGDADYNDFLAKYSIEEWTQVGKDGITMLGYIEGDIIAEAKWAGYDHLFGIAFGYIMEPGDVFEGEIILTYFGSDGQETAPQTFDLAELLVPIPVPNVSSFTHKIVVPLFGSTEMVTRDYEYIPGEVKKQAHFEIHFTGGGVDRDKFQLAPYDPFLYVWNTHYDIHLVGEQVLPAIPALPGIDPITELKSDGTAGPYTFMDGESFPWALLVPVDWEHPAETQRIEEVYPFFTNWRLSEGASDTDWYLRPMDPDNDPPGVPTLNPVSLEFNLTAVWPQVGKFDVTLGSDPDGDDAAVILEWTVPLNYVDRVIIELNDIGPETHKVTVDLKKILYPPDQLNVYFWCEDGEGARSNFTPLNLTFVEPDKSVLVIDTFAPNGAYQNDTYLTLIDKDGTIVAIADDGNPFASHDGYSRIVYSDTLSNPPYYVKVNKNTGLGGIYYGIRFLILDYDPGTTISFPVLGFNADPSDSDDAVDSAGIPLNPVNLIEGATLNRALNPELIDVDWFRLILP